MIWSTFHGSRKLLLIGLVSLAAASCLAVNPADAAPGCRKASVSGSNRAIDPSRINQRLLNAAIVAEVNYLRCRKNLPKLSAASGLHRVSVGHAKWMAKSRRLTHNSTIRGKRTPSQRILGTGVKARMGSENIAVVSLYRVDQAGRFRISNAATCSFSTSSGARIGRHSYASLASYAANLWYNSRGHRKNMMDGRARLMGVGAGFDAKASYCGDIYLAQSFAG